MRTPLTAARPPPFEKRLGNTVEKSQRSLDKWSYLEEFKRPEQGCDKVIVGVKDMHFRSWSFGRRVKDPTALEGMAIEAHNRSDDAGAAWLFFGNVAADADAKYIVRFRARVDRVPGGTGEAFNAVYGNERIAPRVEDVKDGWQWYAFKPKKIYDNQEFYFASGRFSKGGGRAAVNGVRIDQNEISRVDVRELLVSGWFRLSASFPFMCSDSYGIILGSGQCLTILTRRLFVP